MVATSIPLAVNYGLGVIERTDLGLAVTASPSVLDVINVLIEEYPKLIANERIALKVAGWKDVPARATISVHVMRANKQLALIGAHITSRHTLGYRIELSGDAGLGVVLPASLRPVLSRMATKAQVSIDEVVRRQLAPLMEQHG